MFSQRLIASARPSSRDRAPTRRSLAQARPDFVFAFHDREEIGPRMLARIAKRTGLIADRVALPMNMPGIAFLHDREGRGTAALIDLGKHKRLWEDPYGAYTARRRRAEPRESLTTVKRLIEAKAKRKARG